MLKKGTLILIFYFLTFLFAFFYYNSMVSYQYEVKEARFMIEHLSNNLSDFEKESRLMEIDQKEQDINQAQFLLGSLGILAFLSALGLSIKWIFDRASSIVD